MKRSLNLSVDMYGCPNSCRHCWLGSFRHRPMQDGDDEFIMDYFAPYFDKIAYYSWLREPDLINDYEARWERDKVISKNTLPQRFELACFFRLSRDADYAKFLKKVGVDVVQLTFFGMEDMTDKYVGRFGAFGELIKASDVLIENGIAPRYQAFINQENKDDIVKFLEFVKESDIENRCEKIGIPFKFFVHEGSCDGENRKLYDIRIAKEDVPKELLPYYLNFDRLMPEKQLCEMLKNEQTPFVYHNSGDINLQVTSDFSVYYNFTHISPNWKIGNIKDEPAERLVERIISEDTFALNEARKITLAELVSRYGDTASNKAFSIGDYKEYLLNEYIDSLDK